MPRNKDLKRLTRARMEKTGEAYTTARSRLLAKKNRRALEAGSWYTKPLVARRRPRDSAPVSSGLLRPLSLALGLCLAVAASGQDGAPLDAWPYYGGDAGSTKYSPLAQINAATVDRLEVVWRWSSPDNALSFDNVAFEATPLMIGGVLYLSTSYSQVAAVDATTGQTLWIYDPRSYRNGPPPNNGFLHRGVAYWTDGSLRRILHSTGDGRLISLDAAIGTPDPLFGNGGTVDLRAGIPRIRGARDYGNTSPPMAVGDVVVVGSSVHDGIAGPTGPPGDVRGFDVRTGALLWTFRTIPRPGEFGNETWENGSWREAGATNVWAPMSADLERGYVYLPVSAPINNYYGGHRPGHNLFANSLVCLDARTGQRVWHFQTVHHDIWDYDLGSPPNLVDIRVGGRRIPAVAQVTKMGFTFVFDRRNGTPVWPIEERPVPASDVPGERTSATQPFPTKPPPFTRQGITIDELTHNNREGALALLAGKRWGELYTPPSTVDTILNPGIGGGANWGGASVDPETRMLYVTALGAIPFVIRLRDVGGGYHVANKVEIQRGPDEFYLLRPPYGTITAIDLDRGRIAWQRPNQGKDGIAGISSSLVTASLLFYANRSSSLLQAFNKANGRRVWSMALGGDLSGAPMTFSLDGRQYLVAAVGKGSQRMELVALSLSGDLPPSGSVVELVEGSRQVSERAGEVSVAVERRDGSEGAVSAVLRVTGGTASEGPDFVMTRRRVAWEDGEDGLREIVVRIVDDELTEELESATFELVLADAGEGGAGPSLGASTFLLEIADDDIPPCAASATVVCVGENGRFQVSANYRTADVAGAARARSLSQDTGYFTFFDDSNVEVVLKVLDGCELSGHFWVFAAGLTSVEVALTVLDTETGLVAEYSSPLGEPFAPVQDVSALAACSLD